MIADTTPLMRLLDGRFPDRAMFPPGAVGVVVHALEVLRRVDCPHDGPLPLALRGVRPIRGAQDVGGDEARAANVLNWGPRACRATGTESAHQQRAAEDEYRRILAACESQLQTTAFLLGDRPTAVDCIVLGGLRAHTYMDPTPKRLTEQFPTVVEWTTERADQWAGGGELMTLDQPTPFAAFVLDEMQTTYAPYAIAARDAIGAGAKAFQVDIYDETVSYLTRPYIEQSRQMVVDHIADLDSAERATAINFLDDNGLRQVFA